MEGGTIPLAIEVEHFEVGDVAATMLFEELESSTTIIACCRMHHLTQAQVSNVTVQVSTQVLDPFGATASLRQGRIRRVVVVTTDIRTEHRFLEIVIIILVHGHGGTEVTFKVLELDTLLSHKRTTLGILAGIPIVRFFVSRHHECRVL